MLQAFGQIADTLLGLQHDAEALAAQASLELNQESYTAGQATFLQVLTSQRPYQQARLGYARSKAQRHQDTVQFFVAMGGGWREAGLSERTISRAAASCPCDGSREGVQPPEQNAAAPSVSAKARARVIGRLSKCTLRIVVRSPTSILICVKAAEAVPVEILVEA